MASLDRLPDDVAAGPTNFDVGQKMLCENDRVRVWEISLAPGARHVFHCHRTSYFWVAHTGARVRVSYPDGAYHDYEHQAGEVRPLSPGVMPSRCEAFALRARGAELRLRRNRDGERPHGERRGRFGLAVPPGRLRSL
jgi:hypothetical protein